MKYSVLEIIQRTTSELGLAQPATVISNTDTTIVQLFGLLTGLCEELVADFDWPELQMEASFVTEVGKANYPLPSDFARIINHTQWKTSSITSIGGGMTPAAWQAASRSIVGTDNYSYRLRANELWLTPTPTDAEGIVYEYVSSDYIYDETTQTYSHNFTKDSEKIVFDDRLLINGLKLKFKEANGLGSASAAYDYETHLTSLKAAAGGADVINIGRRKSSNMPNIPDGNWNQ